MEHEGEGDGDTNCNCCAWNPQRFGNEAGRVGNVRTNGDHQNYNIVKISLNTEKSLGVLRRLGVTQILAKDHQLMLVWVI